MFGALLWHTLTAPCYAPLTLVRAAHDQIATPSHLLQALLSSCGWPCEGEGHSWFGGSRSSRRGQPVCGIALVATQAISDGALGWACAGKRGPPAHDALGGRVDELQGWWAVGLPPARAASPGKRHDIANALQARSACRTTASTPAPVAHPGTIQSTKRRRPGGGHSCHLRGC